jgi:septal ring factor EnvC (AmiA/AmiB activator)
MVKLNTGLVFNTFYTGKLTIMKKHFILIFFSLFIFASYNSFGQVDSSKINETQKEINKDQKKLYKLEKKVKKQEKKKKHHERKMNRKENKMERKQKDIDKGRRKIENYKKEDQDNS